MPRNPSGTYTLPAGNPVEAGTLIEANWANTTLNDIANELTDSLSRSGEGGMLAPFRLADGLQATPGIAWLNEPSTGFYRAGSGEMWGVVSGTQVLQYTANGVLIPASRTFTNNGNTTLGGTLAVTGASTLTGALTANGGVGTTTLSTSGLATLNSASVTGNLSVGGTLTLTGGLTLNGNVTVGDSSADTLTINSTITSNMLFTDNTYDIGASGATRPRHVYVAGNGVFGGTLGVTGVATLTANPVLSAGTANGVLYLDGSKVATSGSAITYDGTTFKADAAAVFNESGADVDFRVESDGNTHMLFVDAGNNRVGIGKSVPEVPLHVASTLSGTAVIIESSNDSSPDGPTFNLWRNSATPVNGDGLGSIVFQGENSTGGRTTFASIRTEISDETAASEDGLMSIRTIVNGADTARINLKSDEVVFNEGGVDNDFRVESDNKVNMFYIDAGTDTAYFGGSDNRGFVNIEKDAPLASAGAFTSPHIALQALTQPADNDGYVGISFATSDSDNYGFTVGAQRTTAGNGNLVIRSHFNSATGSEIMTIGGASVVINEDGNDIDFRIESDTITHAFFLQGSDGNIGIGTSSPTAVLTTQTSGTLTLDSNDANYSGVGLYITSASLSLNAVNAAVEFGSNAGRKYAAIGMQTYADLDQNGLNFYVQPNAIGGSAALVEAMRITSAGELLVGKTTTTANGGVLQVSNGVTFPATQVACSDANTLDDYEEGTWTPVVADAASGGNASATAFSGNYTKIGNVVTVTAACVNINTSGLTAGNVAYIRGLPFASGDIVGSTGYFTGSAFTASVSISATPLAVLGDNGQTVLNLNDGSAILVSDLTSGAADIWFTLTYNV